MQCQTDKQKKKSGKLKLGKMWSQSHRQNEAEKANVDLHCIIKCKTEIKPDKSERSEKQKKSKVLRDITIYRQQFNIAKEKQVFY